MNDYCHHVSGFFPLRDEAQSALSRMVEKGLPREKIQIFSANSASVSSAQEAKSDAALKDILVDGAIGTAAGTGIGALGSVALAASSVTLFVASPLVAPLMLIGWGASIGGLIGAATGATGSPDSSGNKEGSLSDLVKDAIANGQVVLVANTRSEQETAMASEVIEDSVGKYNDTNVESPFEPTSQPF
ncbi:hypothetical protein [Lacimicrobium alkaliphilum]|uniref:DUF1269 domain-containing protein n=1 Tax=Lacimicrobium alkaliphilum TaxID=1526571 RepID=A0ABQ1RQI5_9ALTE|nr:hypothetical protein [Lacimicrobium alkaliphilum]GGD76131.1 hypothetical protein GCM10011357_33960 [Lacimicrobium alkaliphilum]